MVPKNLVTFGIENGVKFIQESHRNLIRFREKGGSKRSRCAFEGAEKGMENVQSRVEEFIIQIRKGIMHDLLV
jgi:hypothetical protein